MSEYKEIKVRLSLNEDIPEQRKLYEVLTGFPSSQKRNKEIISALVKCFLESSDIPVKGMSENVLPTKQSKAANINEVSGDVRQTIDALYNHIRVINERLSILEYGKASEQTEVLPINTTSPATQPEQKLHAPAAPEPEVIPVKEVEVSDIDNSASNTSDTNFDIDIPDDLLDYVNSLK